MDNLRMIPFEPSLATNFAALNMSWIAAYFVVEPIDLQVLQQPQEYIVDKGGHLFFAELDQEIVGTFALLNNGGSIFELAKMAVASEHQGKGIGNAMLDFCFEEAKRLQIKKLVLYSNTILNPAIHLYKKYGFKEVPLTHADYKRSNIKMEAELN